MDHAELEIADRDFNDGWRSTSFRNERNWNEAWGQKLIDYARELETENRRMRKFMALRVGPEEPRMTELDRFESAEGQQIVDLHLRGPVPIMPIQKNNSDQK